MTLVTTHALTRESQYGVSIGDPGQTRTQSLFMCFGGEGGLKLAD